MLNILKKIKFGSKLWKKISPNYLKTIIRNELLLNSKKII